MWRILQTAALSTLVVMILGVRGSTVRSFEAQADDQKTVQELSARFSEYVARRTSAAESKPSSASADAATVETRLRAWGARTAAVNKQPGRAGTAFSKEATELVRRRLRDVLQSGRGAAARAELEESTNEHIAAPGYEKIEIGSPVSAPELPFALAEALPRVPHGLEYRFSGDRLLLRDESTSVLIDYVSDALPVLPKRQAPAAPAASPTPPGAAAKVIPLPFPNLGTSVKFAVIGDTGTGRDRFMLFDGEYRAHAVARRLEELHTSFPFPLALMLGDNMYTDPDTQSRFVEEVVEPYNVLRTRGVVFRAVLGNHDTVDFQLPLAELNLNNRRFYGFEVGNVRFLILHSDEYMRHDTDAEQDAFIKQTLATPFSGWTMAAFHHPLFSSGAHRDQNAKAREAYKVLLNGGARVIFTGHEHFYERTKPKPGLAHFVSGAAAKLRNGDLDPSEDTDVGFDDEHSVMLVEVDRDEMYFEAIGLSGRVRDCGVVSRTEAALSESASVWMKQCRTAIGG